MKRRSFINAALGFFVLAMGYRLWPRAVGPIKLETIVKLPQELSIAGYYSVLPTWIDENEYYQVRSKYLSSGALLSTVETTYSESEHTLRHAHFFASEWDARRFFSEVITRCRLDFAARSSCRVNAQTFLNGQRLRSFDFVPFYETSDSLVIS